MDGNLTNSKLLQHILESAETIKKEKGKKILTVNHVFALKTQKGQRADGFLIISQHLKFHTACNNIFEWMQA